MGELSKLPNIGKAVEKQLNGAGIFTSLKNSMSFTNYIEKEKQYEYYLF